MKPPISSNWISGASLLMAVVLLGLFVWGRQSAAGGGLDSDALGQAGASDLVCHPGRVAGSGAARVGGAYPLDGGACMHGAGRMGRMATACAARPKFRAGRPAGRRDGDCLGSFSGGLGAAGAVAGLMALAWVQKSRRGRHACQGAWIRPKGCPYIASIATHASAFPLQIISIPVYFIK